MGEGKALPEESSVQFSGSNGSVERGVQDIQGGIRAMFIGLQEKLGRTLDARQRIVALISEYAAYSVNRLQIGEDGMVTYERVGEKNANSAGGEI